MLYRRRITLFLAIMGVIYFTYIHYSVAYPETTSRRKETIKHQPFSNPGFIATYILVHGISLLHQKTNELSHHSHFSKYISFHIRHNDIQ